MRSAPQIAHGGMEMKKPPKKFSHMEMRPAKNGGVTITHHFSNYEHRPEDHVFGKDEGEAALAHVAKHMGMSVGDPEDETEEEEQTPE